MWGASSLVQTASALITRLTFSTFLKHKPQVLGFLLALLDIKWRALEIITAFVMHGSVFLASSFFFFFSSQLLNGTVTSNSTFILLYILSNVNKAAHLTCCLLFFHILNSLLLISASRSVSFADFSLRH